MARIYGSDVEILYRELLKTKPGMILTYGRMSRLIDENVKNASNYILIVARNRAKDEKKMLFRAVNGVGLERLNDHRTVSAARTHIEKANKATKNAIHALSCVRNFSKLNEKDQVRFNAVATVSAVLDQFCSPKSIDAVESGVRMKGAALKMEEIRVA